MSDKQDNDDLEPMFQLGQQITVHGTTYTIKDTYIGLESDGLIRDTRYYILNSADGIERHRSQAGIENGIKGTFRGFGSF